MIHCGNLWKGSEIFRHDNASKGILHQVKMQKVGDGRPLVT